MVAPVLEEVPRDASRPLRLVGSGPGGGERARSRFQHVVSALCAPLTVASPDRDRFEGAVAASRLDELLVARLQGGGSVRVARPDHLISSSDPRMLKVIWLRRGSMVVSQAGRRAVVPQGALVAYDAARPYVLEHVGPWETVVLAVPSHLLGPHLGRLQHLMLDPVPTDAGLGRSLVDFLDSLASSGALNSSGALVHVADALTSLTVGVLTRDGHPAPETLADRVRAHALAHLSDPDLCVESIASALGVSVRLVHKSCQLAGFTVASWIRRERLIRVRRDLVNPAFGHRTISAIAARWGILDANHLSRQFTREFGTTPAAVRRGASAPDAPFTAVSV